MLLEVFARPHWLWLLAALFPLALWLGRERARRAEAWSRLGQDGRPRGDGGWSWLGAMALLVVALGQPRWGQVPGTGLPPGHDVVLVIDTSWSMAAEDAVPNRLAVAQEAAESLVSALGSNAGNRAAVVAFAGRGVLRCPLTENLGAVVDALKDLHPGEIQPGGTDLASGLDAALDAFDDEGRAEGRSIIVFSDGEDHQTSWPQTVLRLKVAGLVVHAVAIGDAERGHAIPAGPEGEPLKYRGEPVSTRRIDAPLTAICQATGGAVVPLGLKATDLGTLYQTRIAPVARQRREAERPGERVERFGVFVLAALALGLAGSWPRRRRLWSRPLWAGLGLALLALAGAGAGAGSDGIPATAGEAVSQGLRAFEAGDLDRALAAFDRAITLAPASPVPRYDAAATLFQLKRYDESLARYQEARDRASGALREKIDFALGNTALGLGDVEAAIGHYDDCLASRAWGAGVSETRRDAEINRRFAVDLAKRVPRPPDDSEGKKPLGAEPKKRSPRDAAKGRDPSGSEPQLPEPDESSSASGGPRGPGGAGGTGSKTPRAGSPEARLAAALQDIRAARRRRLADAPPTPTAAENQKNW